MIMMIIIIITRMSRMMLYNRLRMVNTCQLVSILEDDDDDDDDDTQLQQTVYHFGLARWSSRLPRSQQC